MSNKVSMREVVKSMDETCKKARNGEVTVAVASMSIGELNSIIRLVEVQVATAKASGRVVNIPDLDFIDYS